MSFLIPCTGCKHELTLLEAPIGQTVQCPNCLLEFAAFPAAVPTMEVDAPAPPPPLLAYDKKPADNPPQMETGYTKRERSTTTAGPSIYCVLCGTRADPHDEKCSNCGCPIQSPRDDDPRIRRRRGRMRSMPPVRGIYAIIGALLLPAGIVFYIAAAIIEDGLFRRHPLREQMFLLAIFFGILVQVCGLVFCAIWLYQAWRALIQDDEEYSPGLMIALLFVPFFNLYWIFQVVPGLSKAIHRELRSLEPRRASSAGWVPGLVACVLALIPYAQPIAFCVFVAWMLIANNAIQRLNRLHEEWLDAEDEAETSGRHR